MALYRRPLLLRCLFRSQSHLHPRILNPQPSIVFSFAAERPLYAPRCGPSSPHARSAARIPETTSALVGPRLSLHLRVQTLIRSGDLDGASLEARAAVSSQVVLPTVFTCNALIANTVRTARHDDAVSLFNFFFRGRSSNIVPNVVSYNNLILAHHEAARVVKAYYEMLHGATSFSPSAVSYRHFTKGLVDAGRIQDAFNLLRVMLSRGHGADSIVYKNLIDGYIHLDNWDRAFDLFADFF